MTIFVISSEFKAIMGTVNKAFGVFENVIKIHWI